ncbi:MAG TPA: hypothetical protein VN541_22780 [Tepidisphaeraceae bacterium]|nr:hypothetical protein [Tepidisphaeraceae bacterium]
MSRAVRNACIVVACGFASLGAEAPAPPHRAAALRVERQYAISMDKARKEMLAADTKRIAGLDAALKLAVNAKDLKDAESIETLKSEAQTTMEEHASGHSGESMQIAGTWVVHYVIGNVRVYTVDKNGDVSLPEAGATGHLRSGILDLHDGKLERWTPVRDMIVVEHFNPASDFPNHRNTVGVAVRQP